MAAPDRPVHRIANVELVVDAAPDAAAVARMRALLDNALPLRPAGLVLHARRDRRPAHADRVVALTRPAGEDEPARSGMVR
ncbi:hypothetical protein [Luedemannella helvata]|uniref:Uncharacterized protein n=1 Tax=Luedemannella helvata TaxID=349315 RepID=A0ABP4WYJ9_9ACTN